MTLGTKSEVSGRAPGAAVGRLWAQTLHTGPRGEGRGKQSKAQVGGQDPGVRPAGLGARLPLLQTPNSVLSLPLGLSCLIYQMGQ